MKQKNQEYVTMHTEDMRRKTYLSGPKTRNRPYVRIQRSFKGNTVGGEL